MHLVYLSASLVPSSSANSIQCMHMCHAFSELGLQVVLFARRGTSAEAPHSFYGIPETFPIHFTRWPFWPVGGVVSFADLSVKLRRSVPPPNVVYSRSIYGALAASHAGIPVIYEVHAPPNSMVRRLFEQLLIASRGLVRVVSISHALRREYLRLFPSILREHREVIVAPDAAAPPPAVHDSLLFRPANPNRLQAGYVGNLYPGKGLELVLQIACLAPRVDFHIVGGVSASAQSLRRPKHPDNVFFHGQVRHQQARILQQIFDVNLLPCKGKVSVYGGGGDIARWMSPLKLFEYLSSGKPLVASDISVLREVLVDGVNCRLANPDSPSDWARILREFEEEPQLGRRLAANARSEWASSFTWLHRARKVLADLNVR